MTPGRPARALRTAAAVLAAALCGAGCTYMCHVYQDFDAQVGTEGWRLTGDVWRHKPASWPSAPGSWPHWSADPDDRYELSLMPVAADTAVWATTKATLGGVEVIAGRDTVPIIWAEVVDRLARKNEDLAAGRANGFTLELGRYDYRSEYFRIPVPVPDTLIVTGEMVLRDLNDGAIRGRFQVRARAVISRHRRWIIADMSES